MRTDLSKATELLEQADIIAEESRALLISAMKKNNLSFVDFTYDIGGIYGGDMDDNDELCGALITGVYLHEDKLYFAINYADEEDFDYAKEEDFVGLSQIPIIAYGVISAIERGL